MSLLGSLRPHLFTYFLLSLLTFLTFISTSSITTPASAAIIGIDFGSEFIKVASVKPGTPFHIVIDEQSKRKIPSVVAFEGGERHFGNGATQMSMRKPKETYWFLHRLLGKSISSPQVADFKQQGFPYDIVEIENRNSIGFAHTGFDGNTTIYSTEELIAMNLQHIIRICEADADAIGTIKDAVLTVPSYWTQKERQAIWDAAELAGLNVLSLINDNSAAAIQYGIDRKYNENEPTHTVVFYNMGSTATTVSLVEFTSYTVKNSGGRGSGGSKNKTIGQAEVRATAYDDTLGGQYFEARLTDWIVEQVNKELIAKKKETTDIKTNARAMAKIRSAAEKAKTVLSANSEVPIFLTSLVHDMDFKMHLTREHYVGLVSDLIARVNAPLISVLKESGYQADQVDSVIIIGGNVRIPAIQQAIKTVMGKDQLGQGLNGDESFAMGAVFRAANQSTAFQVRPFGLTDITPYPVGVRIADLDAPLLQEAELTAEATNTENNGEDESTSTPSTSSSSSTTTGFSKRASLFKRNNRLGKRKTVAFQHDKDFSVNLFHDNAALLPKGVSPAILAYNVTGLTEAVQQEKFAALLATQKPRVSLSFLLDASGMTSLVKAEATLEEMVKVLVPKKVEKVNATETDENNSTTTASEEGKEKAEGETTTEERKEGERKTGEEEKKSEETVNSEEKTNTDTPTDSTTDAEPEYKMEKKIHYLSLKVTRGGVIGTIQPMTSLDKKESRAKLNRLTRADETKKEIAIAKNTLESYIYSTRSSVQEKDDLQAVSTEEQREEVVNMCSAAEDWLYEQAEDSAAIFTNKLDELKQYYEPIAFRASEITARPEAISSVRQLVNFTRTQITDYKANRPYVSEADLNQLEKLVDEFESYLSPLLEQQEKLSASEVAVIRSADLYERMKPIAKLSSELMKIKKPVEKVKEKKKNRKGKKNQTEETNETETTEAEPAEPTETEGTNEQTEQNEVKVEPTENTEENHKEEMKDEL